MTSWFKKISGRGGLAAAKVPEGFTAINDTLREDIFVVGFPKSGNTWFQNLVAGAVHGVLPEFAPPGLIYYDLIPDTHARSYYKRYATPTYFKSHHLPRPEYRRVIYLLRDGRDAMVSYFAHLEAMNQHPEYATLLKPGGGLFPSLWHEHVAAWLENPFQAEMITVRYEDLKTDTVAQLRRLCAFARIERDDAFLQMVARSASFDKMQRKERTVGLGDGPGSGWRKDKMFFRRGEVGSYQDEMPPDALRAFLEISGPTLRKLGYS